MEGWSEQETMQLVLARRQKAGAKEKDHSYFERTVRKAFDGKNGKSSSRQQGQGKGKPTAQREADLEAATRYIEEESRSGKSVYWEDAFYQVQGGIWRQQSRLFFQKKLQEKIVSARGSSNNLVVPRETLASALQSLSFAVTPPCIDTSLLREKDRYKNFDLDSGTIVPGIAFTNGVLHIADDGEFKLNDRDPRHFYTTSRPFAFPHERPQRPQLFDEWILGRLPDEDTRTALWEVLGATVCQELNSMQRMVALLGPGRTGKGSAMRVAAMLVGTDHTVSFTGGPARVAKSHFASSQLHNSALVLFPDMPAAPMNTGMWKDQYVEGLGLVKSLVGGDPIIVEKKFKDPTTAVLNASVWVDSNFSLSWFVQGQEDSYSWEERIITIPFLLQLSEEARKHNYESRFQEELPNIAWYALDAYAQVKKRGRFTWSTEMLVRHTRLSQGKHGALEGVLNRLYSAGSGWISRAEVRKMAEHHIGGELDNGQANVLYRYCLALDGVEETKRNGAIGLKNLGVREMKGGKS